MPTRHAGRLASRASTWPRDHFCRSTIAPRSSWPTTWNEFLPISMPRAAIPELRCRMACSLSSMPQASLHRWRGWSTAGLSHYVWSGRALQEDFVDLADAVLHQCIRSLIGARSRSGPSWISARMRHHYRTDLEWTSWVTSVRMRREDRSSISSHLLADLGG